MQYQYAEVHSASRQKLIWHETTGLMAGPFQDEIDVLRYASKHGWELVSTRTTVAGNTVLYFKKPF